MHNSQNKKTLQIVLIVLVAVLTLGIGYAAISAVNLIINGNATANPNDANFKVHFVKTADTPNLTGNVTLTGSADIDKDDNTVASFNVGGLSKEGDYAIATYTIINNSNDVGAKLSLELTNSNADYFKVTETITDTELQAGDTTTGTVKVEMIKTPVQESVTTSITAKIKSTAVENDSATGESPASKVAGDPESFSTDSWATIQKAVQNNNTSVYNVGDTKTVTINGTDYTVRIANKSTSEQCNNQDYSETACGFVVEFADIVYKSTIKSNSNSNYGGYPNSNIYTYLRDTLYNQLPNDLQSSIIETRVVSGHGCLNDESPCTVPDNNGNNFVTNDKLYILSGVEIIGSDEYDSAATTTRQLDFYRIKGIYQIHAVCGPPSGCDYNVQIGAEKKFNGSVSAWWGRSADMTRTTSYRSISERYSQLYTPVPHGNIMQIGVSPAFRIG